MVAMYNIAGRQVGSHVLAMVTLGTIFGGAYLSMGGSKAKKADGPPINAQSPGEESFIKDFLAKAEQDEKKGDSADATKKAAAH